MLKIRLQRTGRRNLPAFRIVVAEHARPVKGKSLEILGHYLPNRDPIVFECNTERISHWISKGAKPSDTVARLLKNNGVDGLDSYIETYTKKKKRKQEEVKEEVKAPKVEGDVVKDDSPPPEETKPMDEPSSQSHDKDTSEAPKDETQKDSADTEVTKEPDDKKDDPA